MEVQLFDAINSGDIETIRILLYQGANVNAKNSGGNTPLHEAVLKEDEEIVKYLIDAGSNVNLENDQALTALDLALDIDSPKLAVYSGVCPKARSSIMKMLVMSGADVNTTSKDNSGMSVLHFAAGIWDVDFVRILIARGANVDAVDKDEGQTPLHYAAGACIIISEDPTMFEVLLSANPDVNAKDSQGETPLHLLSKYKPIVPSLSLREVFQLFSMHDVDFNVKNKSEFTPVDYAVRHSNVEALEALVRHGGINVNSILKLHLAGTNGETILHEACRQINLPIIKLLLKKGADIDALDCNNKSPLKTAIDTIVDGHDHRNGFNYQEDIYRFTTGISVLVYLLKWNPNINTITKDGLNILTSSSYYEMPVFLGCIILQHLAKVCATERPINPSLIETINTNRNYRNYFGLCYQELQIIKNSYLHSDSWVTLLNLLMDDKSRLLQYAGNSDLVKGFTACNVFKNFPIFGPLINDRFSIAVEKRLIWDDATKTLSDLLPINLDPTHRIVTSILSFFNSKELKKIVYEYE